MIHVGFTFVFICLSPGRCSRQLSPSQPSAVLPASGCGAAQPNPTEINPGGLGLSLGGLGQAAAADMCSDWLVDLLDGWLAGGWCGRGCRSAQPPAQPNDVSPAPGRVCHSTQPSAVSPASGRGRGAAQPSPPASLRPWVLLSPGQPSSARGAQARPLQPQSTNKKHLRIKQKHHRILKKNTFGY
jgi:hypothetical protein